MKRLLGRDLIAAVPACQLPPYPATRRPILPTAALSSQLPPYPANRRPILTTSGVRRT
ncbi:hypothetical protein T484DRAFT_1985760 [Baffinella frigidus]|nr:hypothetical protein T484DRAFT_1985760 [Cryptophyta sp. CCMP2293]